MKIEGLLVKEDSENLKSEITIIDDEKNSKSKLDFPSLIGAKVLSDDGSKAFIATLFPNNTIYCYDINEDKIIWKYKNHSHKPIQGLNFQNNVISVSTGKTEYTRKEEYELNLDGIIPGDCKNQLDNLAKVKEQSIDKAIPEISEFFNSEHRTVIFKSIIELQSLTYDRKIKKYYPLIVKELPTLLKFDDQEIFELTWKLIRRIIRKDPDSFDGIVPDILLRLKKIDSDDRGHYLYYLEELCSTKTKWIENEISYLNEIIQNSEDTYEIKDAKSILELYNRKTEKIPQYQFPISINKIKFSEPKTYNVKTKDHLLSFSNGEIVSRIGWTKPSKIVRLDSGLNEKWKIAIDGRVRGMDSDEFGTILSESSFIKNEELGTKDNESGRFFSSLYTIDTDGRIIWKLEKIDGFVSIIGFTPEKILVWNDFTPSIQCLKRENGEKLWEKSFTDLLNSKYAMKVFHYYEIFDKFLMVRMSNEQKKPVTPSIISVLDGKCNVLNEFEHDVFTTEEEEEEQIPNEEIVIQIDLGSHYYPIYHAMFSPDGENIITGHYDGQVASWTLDGKLNWVFECKNKVKLGLSITDDGLVSALCENGDYFLIENGKEIMHSILEIDFSSTRDVFSIGKYAALGYDKKIMFFDRSGKVGELEFKDKLRSVTYSQKENLLAVAAGPISVVQIE